MRDHILLIRKSVRLDTMHDKQSRNSRRGSETPTGRNTVHRTAGLSHHKQQSATGPLWIYYMSTSEAMINPDSKLKSKDTSLPTKVHPVKAAVFPVVMFRCTIKKAEHLRIAAFKLWCWRRLSRVPWTARRSNPSMLKELNYECSLEGLMLKVKLQHSGHMMQRVDSSEKPGKDRRQQEKGGRGWDGQVAPPTRWMRVWANSESWWKTGKDVRCAAVQGVAELDTP